VSSRRPASVRRAVAQFAITGLLAVALVGLIGFLVLRSTGRREAIDDAKRVTALAADGIAGPAMTRGVLDGDPRAVAHLDRIVRRRVLRGSVVRVKVWDASGRIVYADEPRLIGSSYTLGADDVEALRDGRTDAEISDLSRPENRFERGDGKLLEVYQGIRARDGTPVLFEAYQRYSSISASATKQWRKFAPALIGVLLLLYLAQLPLAWSLARRLRRGQAEREALLQTAVDASGRERARIARDLHDGPVQALAGVSYSLSAAAGRLHGDDRAVVESAGAGTRDVMRELRGLLVDLYPPSLHREGLEAALRDLVAPLRARDVEVALDVDEALGLGDDAEALVFRAAQEAVRNVVAHAGAQRVEVGVQRVNGHAVLTVADDGRGFMPGDQPEGHFGLRLIGDLAAEAGGRLDLDSAPGAGTRVRVELPA
jgi:signal transduction histidine kinase